MRNNNSQRIPDEHGDVWCETIMRMEIDPRSVVKFFKNNCKKIWNMFLYLVYLWKQNDKTMRKNAKRIIDLRTELINEIKDTVSKQGDKLTFTTYFNVGVDTIEFDDDYQRIMRRAESITNDGYVYDEEGSEVCLEDLGTTELGFILDELQENKFEIF